MPLRRPLVAAGLVAAALAVRAAAADRRPRPAADVPKSVVRNGTALRLNIADRAQAPERPKSGWCGETAIQMALLFHGAFFPQRAINKAGKPRHPDLYARDIPVALSALNADVAQWRWQPCELAKFLAWMKQEIKSGHPVLAGVKINPTAHPNWGLDHFVLAVGFDDKSLTLNTTWGKPQTRTLKDLLSTRKGLAFKNRYNSYYGIRIKGLRDANAGTRPVRLFAAKETREKMTVVVKCESLEPEAEYVVEKRCAIGQKNPDETFRFQAKAHTYAFRDTINKKRPAIYRCRKATER